MNTCATCKYWCAPEQRGRNEAQTPKEYGVCEKIDTFDICAQPKGEAYTTSDIDGSPLYTRATFGCTLYKEGAYVEPQWRIDQRMREEAKVSKLQANRAVWTPPDRDVKLVVSVEKRNEDGTCNIATLNKNHTDATSYWLSIPTEELSPYCEGEQP